MLGLQSSKSLQAGVCAAAVPATTAFTGGRTIVAILVVESSYIISSLPDCLFRVLESIMLIFSCFI